MFLAPEVPRMGGGGGGGGNQQPGPIRRAQGVGSDSITLRVRKEPPPTAAPVPTASASAVEDLPPLPSIVLEAKPLASGLFDQIGLPTGGVMSGTSTGPGSGGGVGTGRGTGIGSGTWARTRPRIRRWNWRRRLPPRRGGIRTAPDQRGQTEVHERGARQQNSRHGCPGSRRHRRRMHVANPYRPIAGPQGVSMKKP